MIALNFIFAFLLQTQVPAAIQAEAPTVVVGLMDGQQLPVANPRFTGFIKSNEAEAVLLYRQKNFHGEMSVSSIQRIDFGYRKGRPFPLRVTLKNGQKLDCEPDDSLSFLTVKGFTDTGSVMVKHPDPISPVVRMSSRKQNRKDDLTIQYLEFPR